MFDRLIERGSLIGEGFFMNDLLSLFRKDGKVIDEKDIILLKRALRFMKLIDNGKRFVTTEKHIDKLGNSLELYSRALNILISEKIKTIKKFDEIMEKIKGELDYTLKINKIDVEKLLITINFFKLNRIELLKQLHNI